MAKNSDQSDVYTRMKQMVDNQIRGIHTASVAIVQEVDRDNQRVEVALKEDEEMFIGDVPIASMFARNGEGVISPLEPDDEGLLFHPREPLYNKQAERGHNPTGVDRHHTLESAVFFPMFFYDEDEKPPYDDGQLRVYLKDSPPTESPEPSIDIRIDPYDPGEVEVIVMDAGDPAVSFIMKKDGGAEIVAFDAGTPKSQVTINQDGSVEVVHKDSGNTWTMAADGFVKINGSKVLTMDALVKHQDTGDSFLGLKSAQGKESTIDKAGQE